MINTTSIRNNIKKREIEQLNNIIETSSSAGMISLKKYAERLVDKKIVDPEAVDWIMKATTS
jgi:Tfp pilus assembly pilus retraction ATPase PilT